MPEKIEGIPLVTGESRKYLNERQVEDYANHRRQLLQWILHFGMNPEKVVGYAKQTVYQRAYRIDAFYRWVWEKDSGYTIDVRQDHADAYMRDLARSDYSMDHKANLMKAIKMLFRWRAIEHDGEEGDPEITFTRDERTELRDPIPSHSFTRDERMELREGVLELGSIPHYNSISPTAIWKAQVRSYKDGLGSCERVEISVLGLDRVGRRITAG